jgi:AmiR/NasT family two-component response regulator
MLTAQDEPNLTQEASRLGAEALLHKPCSIEQLTAVLTAAIATSH